MWKIARIGQGKHQKAWEQEIRRVHNSNPLQRHNEHVHAAIVLIQTQTLNIRILVAYSLHKMHGRWSLLSPKVHVLYVGNNITLYHQCDKLLQPPNSVENS